MAAATTRDSTATNPGGTGTTITVTLPTHAAGDIITIVIGNTGNVLWAGNPAGWDRVDQRSVGTAANGLVGTVFKRRVLSGDSIPLANPTFTLGATVSREAFAWADDGASEEGVMTLSAWGARGFATGTANPVRPPSVTTLAPEMLVHIFYFQRAATNAPDQSGYTQDEEIIISGTLVGNAASKTVADQNTVLSNQDASPTSGARWVAGIICIPSADYPYYRSGSQATTPSGTQVTPVKPAGTTNSDVNSNADIMIATVEGAGSTTLAATDTDLWTPIGGVWSGVTSGGGSSVKKFWAKATASPNMQFTRTGTGEISACITTYYNCDQVNPVGVFDADARASSTTSTFDAITRSASKTIVQATCVADGTPTYTAPAGWVERMDGLGIVCADQIYNATGSSASASFTLNSANPTLVGLLEIFGASSIVEFSRTVVVDAVGTISTASQFFSILSRTVAVDATAVISATGIREVSRSVAIDGSASVAVSGEVLSPVFERSVSINALGSVETTAESFSVVERAVSCETTSSIEAAGVRVVNRSITIDAVASVSASATSFTVLESVATLNATGSIEADGIAFLVLERAATLNATGAIESTGLRIVDRSVSLSAGSTIESSAQFFSTLERSVQISATAAIETSAQFFSVFERSLSINGITTVTTNRQVELNRQVDCSVTAAVTVSGDVIPPGAEHERSVSLNATGVVESSAVFFSTLDRVVALNGEAVVSVSTLTVRERVAAITVSAAISVTHQRELLRAAVVSGTGLIATSGVIVLEGVATFERSVTVSTTATTTVNGGILLPTPSSRTFMVESPRRTLVVPFSNRAYLIPESDREEIT